MSEKVLREIKIIETDDGFRIEMTGDKEELRKMLFEQGKPFFMPFGRGRGFGGHGPFGHHHEHGQHEHGFEGHGPFGHEHHEHGHHEHGQHGHDPREHMRPPFEGREQPMPEEMRNQHFFFQRFARRGDWKAKRGGYNMGPWWDEDAAPDEETPASV
jgi:hypothetical protein